MATRMCWNCETVAHMTAIGGSGDTISYGNMGDQYDQYLKQSAFTCDNCGRMSIGTYTDPSQPNNVEGWLDEQDSLGWLPVHVAKVPFPNVPNHIADAATEATLCLSFGAYRAVGALARAVVEAVAKEKGITKGQLYNKIEELEAAGHVRALVKDQAHEIRHFGNDMAHGDFTDPVTKEGAEEVIELMAEILKEVYQAPARLAARKAARLAKQAATGS